MADILALERLYNEVTARFKLEGTDAVNLFGWKTPAQKLVTGNRITWVPGDPSGQIGDLAAPKQPGRVPRSLGTLNELFTCEITAVDRTALENELAQYKAARLLFDAWYRAVYLAARGTFVVKRNEWLIDKKERRFGATIRVVTIIEGMIPDDAVTLVAPPFTGEIDVTELDVTEVVTSA